MLSSIPIEAFERAHDAIFVADHGGAVRMINRPAELILGCAGGEALGRPCWHVAQLHYRNGVPFCGPDCPVRRQARENGGRIEKQWLSRKRARGRAVDVELYTVVATAGPEGGSLVLHLLTPSTASATRHARHHRGGGAGAGGRPVPGSTTARFTAERRAVAAVPPEIARGRNRLHLLSSRERQILAFLGRGHSTRRIAEDLCISPNTVRNHIRSILEKLRVHRRLEAALLWIEHRG